MGVWIWVESCADVCRLCGCNHAHMCECAFVCVSVSVRVCVCVSPCLSPLVFAVLSLNVFYWHDCWGKENDARQANGIKVHYYPSVNFMKKGRWNKESEQSWTRMRPQSLSSLTPSMPLTSTGSHSDHSAKGCGPDCPGRLFVSIPSLW